MKTTDEIVSLFFSIDEPYAAGLFRAPEKGWFYRHCCAYAEWFRSLNPASYEPGDLLYPRKNRQWGGKTYAAYAQYAHTWMVRFDLLEEKGCSFKILVKLDIIHPEFALIDKNSNQIAVYKMNVMGEREENVFGIGNKQSNIVITTECEDMELIFFAAFILSRVDFSLYLL